MSELYLDCRRALLSACEHARPAWTRAIQHPLRGPSGERLYIDLAWWGPRDARKLLVVGSGTHGAEGPAGSAIQTAAVRAGSFAALPRDVAVLLIHAHNPWGFAWMRRCTEDGVDLNRNFVDFTRPVPDNPRFDERFAELLVPEHPLDAPAAATTDLALLREIGEHGMDHLVCGQYRFAFAPFFGGEAPTWSNRRSRELWHELLGSRRRVVFIDLHTGLGERGRGALLSSGSELGVARARALWGEQVRAPKPGRELGYRTTGELILGLERSLPELEITAVVHEFGTQDAIMVLAAMRADHWVWRHGDPINPNPERDRAQRLMRDAFAPDDPQWLASITDEALAVQHTALAALGE